MSRTRTKAGRSPAFDALEAKVVMSVTAVRPQATAHATVAASPSAGMISGRVTDESSGIPVGLSHVTVELFNGLGRVVATTRSHKLGNYAFSVPTPGTYTVREITPNSYLQTSPTFVNSEPAGDYAPGFGKGSWNYLTGNSDPTIGPVGTGNWYKIAPAGILPFESPINLKGPTVDLSSYLQVNYQPVAAKAEINNGAQIQVQVNPSSSGVIHLAGNQTFTLQQFHFHDPSENHVNGLDYPVELHFVNASADGAETVVAVFFQIGAHNDSLQPILDAATAHLTSPNTTTALPGTIDFAGLLPTNTQGYFYQGSLTTPPLSGPVNWFVYSTPKTLDYAQLMQYEAVAKASGFLPNNRPVQPTNGRLINELGYDVAYLGGDVAGLNFSLTNPGVAVPLAKKHA